MDYIGGLIYSDISIGCMQEGQIQELLDNFTTLHREKEQYKNSLSVHVLRMLAEKEKREGKQVQQKARPVSPEQPRQNKKVFKMAMKQQVHLKKQQRFDLQFASIQPKGAEYFDEFQVRLAVKCNQLQYRLYFQQQKKAGLDVVALLEPDLAFLDNLVENIFLTVKVAKYYLNYEFLKGFQDYPDRYFAILQRVMAALNEEKNLPLLLQDYMAPVWRDLILGLFFMTKEVFQHLFVLNQSFSENQNTETVYLQTFKEAILAHLHNEKLVIEGVRAFVRLRWFKAIKISMKTFGSYPFLLDILLDETTNYKISDMKNLKLDEGPYKDTESAAKFYILMLSKYHQLYDPLFQNYSQFSQAAKDYIIEKLPILLEKHDIPEEYLVAVLRSSYIGDKDVKFIYKIMDYSPQLKTGRPSKQVVAAYSRFVVNYHKEQQVFRFLEHSTTQDLEVMFPVLASLQNEQLRFLVDKLFQVNRTLVQTYLVRLHLEPAYNPQNHRMTGQVREFVNQSLSLLFRSPDGLKQQEVLNVLQYLAKQFLVSPSIMQTLLLTLDRYPSAQVISLISDFLKEIIRKEGYSHPDVQQGMVQLFSLDSNHFQALRDSLPQEVLSQL